MQHTESSLQLPLYHCGSQNSGLARISGTCYNAENLFVSCPKLMPLPSAVTVWDNSLRAPLSTYIDPKASQILAPLLISAKHACNFSQQSQRDPVFWDSPAAASSGRCINEK
jgi:hypothetical protein